MSGTQQHSVDSLWQDIVKTALIGTGQQVLTLRSEAETDSLGTMLTKLDTSQPEWAVLGAAVAVGLYRHAGQLPPTDDQPLPAPCDLADQPRASLRSCQHLATMLNGHYEDALPEYLRRLAARGRRISEEHLPALLDAAQKRIELRPLVAPVLGKRGQWLTAYNPVWNFAVAILPAEWDSAPRPARLALLERLRQSDPAQALELIKSTWSEENATGREEFIARLEAGLSMADEPFLEDALDDRSGKVRRHAAGLLAQLADSRLVARMIERCRNLLKLAKGWKPKIEVTLPETCDAIMKRDGIDEAPPKGSKVGQKTHWLLSMLAAIPPSFWCQAWGKRAAEMLAAAERSEEKAITSAFISATINHKDLDWADAILAGGPLRPALVGILPPERCEALIVNAIRSDARTMLQDDNALVAMLQAYDHPWGDELSRAVWGLFSKQIGTTHGGYRLYGLLARFASRLSVATSDAAEQLLAAETAKNSGWVGPLTGFVDLLRFRHEMIEELSV